TSIGEAIWSEEAGGYGNYAWLVFPEADYYIVAKKEGYKDYVSGTISVEWDIVKHDFQMERLSEADLSTEDPMDETMPKGEATEQAPPTEKEKEESPLLAPEDEKTKGDHLPATATNLY